MPEPAKRTTLLTPIQEFAKRDSSGGQVLLACTLLALVWANTPWRDSYHAIWQTEFATRIGSYALAKPVVMWINDGLMAVFFFVVGMEIKREVLHGELRRPSQLLLPLAAAFGGMLVPALLYAAINGAGPGARGWGVPMATDIAFALAVLAMLGPRVPTTLKVFLTAVAVLDDLGAVLVIALFYSASIEVELLLAGAGVLVAAAVANLVGFRHFIVYGFLGILLWLAFVQSGIHATIGGVLLAMTIPSRRRIEPQRFLRRVERLLEPLRAAPAALDPETVQRSIEHIETACHEVEPPMQRIERALHPWVMFVILPLFALANAGVTLDASIAEALGNPVTLGVIVALVLGKQIGVFTFAWLAIRSGLATLPKGMTWRHLHGIAWLCGIGFTMSLFIANLAFGEDVELEFAKLGVLVASLLAATLGCIVLMGGAAAQAPSDEPNGEGAA